MNKIAFIQGRLVEKVDDKIQAFPRDEWEKELLVAASNNLRYIELTVDYERIWENPIVSELGKNYLNSVLNENQIEVIACTADFFMQKPPWKTCNENLEDMNFIIHKVLEGLNFLKCKTIVIPLVDESSIKNDNEEKEVVDFFMSLIGDLKKYKVQIAFESDFNPSRLREFISIFPKEHFGINYDVGNSASLGYNLKEEFDAYFDRILHIHIKDRTYMGATVPLKTGDVDFRSFFNAIRDFGYKLNFSMQTARAKKGKHLNTMLEYIAFINSELKK